LNTHPPGIDFTFPRRVFFWAGVYGIVALAPLYFLESTIARDFPPPVAHPEYFYGFVGVALAWQALFLIVSRDPVRFRTIMIPAILEKLAFGLAVWILFVQGRLEPLTLGPASVDLFLAVLFAIAYLKTPRPSSETAHG